MKIRSLNKRGSLFDSIAIPIGILGVAMTIFLAYYVWITFATNFTGISDTIILPDGQNLTAITAEITTSISYLDYMFPFLVLGLLIASLIFAFKTGANVIYSYVSIFMWVLALILSVVFETIFEAFAANFTSIGGTFVIVSFVMTNIKWLVLSWAFIISLIMFTRTQADDQRIASAERAFG